MLAIYFPLPHYTGTKKRKRDILNVAFDIAVAVATAMRCKRMNSCAKRKEKENDLTCVHFFRMQEENVKSHNILYCLDEIYDIVESVCRMSHLTAAAIKPFAAFRILFFILVLCSYVLF